MTPVEEVYDSFLQKITDYEIAELTNEDFELECYQLIKSSVGRFMVAEDISLNKELKTFNRELTNLEIDILSLGMVLAWIEPKINNITLYKMRLSSNDYKTYSQANHLKEMREVKKHALSDFTYWSTRYSSQKVLNGLKNI
ncbi:MAG: hypothetical protein RSC24_06670 [Clostridium sp.]